PRCASCCCPTSHCLAVLLHPQRPPPSTLFPYTTLFRSSLSSKSTAFPPGGNTMVGMRLQGSARRVGRRERRRARRAREGRVRRFLHCISLPGAESTEKAGRGTDRALENSGSPSAGSRRAARRRLEGREQTEGGGFVRCGRAHAQLPAEAARVGDALEKQRGLQPVV